MTEELPASVRRALEEYAPVRRRMVVEGATNPRVVRMSFDALDRLHASIREWAAMEVLA